METLAEIRSLLESQVSSSEERRNILEMAKKYIKETKDVKDDYLMALLFPEYAPNCRIPSPFGTPSTLHTEKEEIYVTTNAAGTAMVLFTPSDLHWNLLYGCRTIPTSSTGMGNYSVDGFNSSWACPPTFAEKYLPNLYSHARVVGASLRVTYIGEDDEECGFIVGSEIENENIAGVTDRDIEEGYHVKKVRPKQGLRLAYTPIDDKDFEYTELNTRVIFDATELSLGYLNDSQAINPFSGVPSYMLDPVDLMMTYNTRSGITAGEDPEENKLEVQVRVLSEGTEDPAGVGGLWNFEYDSGWPGTNNLSLEEVGWLDVTDTIGGVGVAPSFHPVNFLGHGPRAGHLTAQFPEILAFYCKGLPKNEECLRIDVTRHLECIPRAETRNYMACERPVFCDSSEKLAAEIEHKESALEVTSLQEAPAVLAATNSILYRTSTSDEVLDNISAIDNSEAYGSIAETDPSLFSRALDAAGKVFGLLTADPFEDYTSMTSPDSSMINTVQNISNAYEGLRSVGNLVFGGGGEGEAMRDESSRLLALGYGGTR